MRFKKIKLKIILFFKVFILAPKVWRKPNKTNILIYDACGADFLLPYFHAMSIFYIFEASLLICIVYFKVFLRKHFGVGNA